MLKIYADFNSRSADGACWILVYQGIPADESILEVGDTIILFQDEDDFEVEAVVDFRFVSELGRESWVATPDWSTKRRIGSR